MVNLQEWRTYKSERDNLFDQVLFFSDYCGVLADGGLHSTKIPNIIELTWVCTQDIYTTVYNFEKDNIRTPCFVELWRDGDEY